MDKGSTGYKHSSSLSSNKTRCKREIIILGQLDQGHRNHLCLSPLAQTTRLRPLLTALRRLSPKGSNQRSPPCKNRRPRRNSTIQTSTRRYLSPLKQLLSLQGKWILIQPSSTLCLPQEMGRTRLAMLETPVSQPSTPHLARLSTRLERGWVGSMLMQLVVILS